MIKIPLALLMRICDAFLDMQSQGAVCHDRTLMQDLDRELAREDRKGS